MGEALAGLFGAGMGGDQFKLLGKQADFAQSGPEPERLADEAMRGRVVGLVEGHVTVAMQLAAFPARRVIGDIGQVLEHLLFDLGEARQGGFAGCAVHA